MIRLLIVDDEPYVVEGLTGLLQEADISNLETYGATSSREALERLARTRVDIVLSDIHMPGMNGLELQKRILAQWPKCKVVFLTGHDTFEYAKEALRHGASDYILKTDGDEEIVAAVLRTIGELEAQLERDTYMAEAQRQMRSALPLLQKEFLLELLRRPPASAAQLGGQLRELGVPLSASSGVLLVQSRILQWPEALSASDRTLLLFAIRNIGEEFWSAGASLVSFAYEGNRIAWLLQPHSALDEDVESAAQAQERLKHFVYGNLEPIQTACRSLLKLSVSFVMASACVPWETLPDKSAALDLMFHRSFGPLEELLLLEGETAGLAAEGDGIAARSVANRAAALASLLDAGEQQAFADALRALMLDESLAGATEAERMTVYYQLVALFMNDLMRGGLFRSVAERIDLARLTRYESHATWEDRLVYFLKLAEALFEDRRSGRQRLGDELIEAVGAYVDSHLSGDLSLTRLGEVFSFNASYLSRVFKLHSGINLTEHILAKRLQEAKRLLRDTSMQVQEITKAVGFESAPYFIRLFKKETDMTPQQYREWAK